MPKTSSATVLPLAALQLLVPEASAFEVLQSARFSGRHNATNEAYVESGAGTAAWCLYGCPSAESNRPEVLSTRLLSACDGICLLFVRR